MKILLGGLGFGSPTIDRWCESEQLPSYLLKVDPEEVTLVTAFFQLTSYKNGAWDAATKYQYKKWMRPLGRVANRIIAFFENEDDAEYFRKIRACLPPEWTKIIKVERKEMWSFSLLPQIKKIYGKSDYPKIFPNTVYPDHTCAAHAKYELLERVLKMNYSGTSFTALIDIGFFRNLDETDFEIFKLIPPATFNIEMVSMTQAWPHDPNIPNRDVIEHNLVWVSGEMLLGVKETLLNFTKVYRQTVEVLLTDDLSCSDEQLICLMYSTRLRKQKPVKVKTYMCHEGQLGLYGKDTRFLCLGYVSKNTWDSIHKPG